MVRFLPWVAAVGLGLAGVGAVLAADVVEQDPASEKPSVTPDADGNAGAGAAPAAAKPPPAVSPTPASAPTDTPRAVARPPVPPPVGAALPTLARPGVAAPAPAPAATAAPNLGRVPPQEFVGPPIEGAGPVKEGTGWESSLAAREVALVRAQIALNQEMTQVRELQAQIEDRWAESERARRFAEEACGASIVARLGDVGVVPPTIEDANERLEYVASLVKKMKPDQAAALMQQWDDVLAVRVLEAVSARAAAPIVSKMPPAVGGRLTRRMATGRPSVGPGAAQ